MPFTLSPLDMELSTYPYWLMVKGADWMEVADLNDLMTETFGAGGGKFPDINSSWGRKNQWGHDILMFRTLEDRTLARLRITC